MLEIKLILSWFILMFILCITVFIVYKNAEDECEEFDPDEDTDYVYWIEFEHWIKKFRNHDND